MAQELLVTVSLSVRRAAWYGKTQATFCDTIAWVRQSLWEHAGFSMSHAETDMVKVPRALVERLTEAVCYAA